MQTGAWRVSYIPGRWLVLSGPTSLVILPPASPQWSDLVRTIWEDVLASASIHDLAARMSAFSLDDMPSFGAFFWTGGQMRSLVRGEVVLTDPATGRTVGSGQGVLTWTEIGLAGLPRVQVDLEPILAEPLVLPLVVGVVSAGAVVLDTTVNDPLEQGTVPIADAEPMAEGTAGPVDEPVEAAIAEPLAEPSAAPAAGPAAGPEVGPVEEPVAEPTPSQAAGSGSEPGPFGPAADAAAELDETSNAETGDTVLAPIVIPEPESTRPADAPFTAEEGETPDSAPDPAPGPPAAAAPSDAAEEDDWEDTQFDLPAVPADFTAPGPVGAPAPSSPGPEPVAAPAPSSPGPEPVAAPAPSSPGPEPVAAPSKPAPKRPSTARRPPAKASESPAPTRPVLAVLRVSTGGRADVDRPVLIGRSPVANRVTGDQLPRLLTVPSPSHDISRTHLEIAPRDGRLVVTDLKSTNGTVLIRPGSPPQDLAPGRSETIEPGCRLDLGDGVVIAVDRP